VGAAGFSDSQLQTPLVDLIMKTKILFTVLLVVTACRAGWVWMHEAAPSEAYFWMCSQRLAPGFFDGPAGTALLVRAFGDSFEAARMFWPVLAFLCSWAAWIFVRRIYDGAAASWAMILLNALPVFNSAAVHVGPLLPALISVLTALVFARLAWEGSRWAWVPAGIFFAAGLLFRYEVVLVPAGLCVSIMVSRRHRKDIAGLAAIAIPCALALWPSLAWNAALEWIPIAGGTWRSAWEFRPALLLESAAVFFNAFSIPVAVVFFAGMIPLVRSARIHARAVFLLAASVPAWTWCVYLLLHGSEAVTPAVLAFLPVFAFLIASFSGQPSWRIGWAVLIALALLTGGFFLMAPRGPDWNSIAEELHAAARDLPASEQSGFFIAEDPDLAAVLGYHIGGGARACPPVFIPESPDLSSQFGLWPSYADFVESDKVADEYFTEQKGVNPFVGRNAVYIGRELPQTIKGAFTEVVPFKTISGPEGKDLRIFLCLGYETLPL